MDRVRWLAARAGDVLALERDLFTTPGLSVPQRLGLLTGRYLAVLRNARRVSYLGGSFTYDNRFLPVLLPSYLREIDRLACCARIPAQPSVLDIGANVGQFAATFLWRYPGSHIWSFEPNDQIIPLLQRNASSAKYWDVLPWGVGAEDCEETLWSVNGKSAQGSIFRSNAVAGLLDDAAEPRSVQIRALTRELADNLGIPACVDIIKIDVEGAEESALRGLVGVRWRYMAIELSRDREGGCSLEQALQLVDQIWGSEPQVLWRSNPTGPARIEEAILAFPSE